MAASGDREKPKTRKSGVTVRVWASQDPEAKSSQKSDLERSHAELLAALAAATRHMRRSSAGARKTEDPLLAQMERALRNARTAAKQEEAQSKAVPVPLSTRMDPMKIALRILTATAEKVEPKAADLDTLTRLYGPKKETAGWDEYACDVIQMIMRERAAGRRLLLLR